MNSYENAPAVGGTTSQSGSKDLINDPITLQRLGQIFNLVKQANELIPTEERGVGYEFEVNKYSVELAYHFMTTDDSQRVKLVDHYLGESDYLAALDETIYVLRNQIVMRKAGLICGMY